MTDTTTHSAWQCPACGHKGNTTARKCSACSWLRPVPSDSGDSRHLIASAENLRDEVGSSMVKTVVARGEHTTDTLAEALVDIAIGQRKDWTLEAAKALEVELSACDDSVETFLSNRDL